MNDKNNTDMSVYCNNTDDIRGKAIIKVYGKRISIKLCKHSVTVTVKNAFVCTVIISQLSPNRRNQHTIYLP